MKRWLLLFFVFNSLNSFCQYNKNEYLIDSIENEIYDTTQPPTFALTVIDSGYIKNYFFHDRINEISGVDIIDKVSRERMLFFYTSGGSIRKIMLWFPDEKWGQVTTEYYFKKEDIFYIDGIVLNTADLEKIRRIASEEYEIAKFVLKNKEQIQKNYKDWMKKNFNPILK